MLILAALITVYIVLGVLYESYIHPITIISTLPVGGRRRAARALRVPDRLQRHRAHRDRAAHRHREEERDHDDRLRARGGARPRDERPSRAIHQACLLRFRPIMMTTMAALCSAACRSRSGPAWAPSCGARSGITIVGGLIISQVLTLYTTPVVYLYMDRLGTLAGPTTTSSDTPVAAPEAAPVSTHLRAVHPAAHRDVAARRGAAARRHPGLPEAARSRPSRASTSRPSR